jgi:hypothetical protein
MANLRASIHHENSNNSNDDNNIHIHNNTEGHHHNHNHPNPNTNPNSSSGPSPGPAPPSVAHPGSLTKRSSSRKSVGEERGATNPNNNNPSNSGTVSSPRVSRSPVTDSQREREFMASCATNGGGSLFSSYFGGIQSIPESNEIYFMGIIDILQVSSFLLLLLVGD